MRFDVVIIGGGLSGTAAGVSLLQQGLCCCIIGGGLSLHETARAEYIRLGGTFLPGDYAISGEFGPDGCLKAVRTACLGETILEADHFILATGRFVSRGLISTMDSISEPIFGADVKFDPCRDHWYNADFNAHQPFEDFGVMTDESLHVMIGGSPVPNLYAVGEILAAGPSRTSVSESVSQVCRLCRNQ